MLKIEVKFSILKTTGSIITKAYNYIYNKKLKHSKLGLPNLKISHLTLDFLFVDGFAEAIINGITTNTVSKSWFMCI